MKALWDKYVFLCTFTINVLKPHYVTYALGRLLTTTFETQHKLVMHTTF